MYPKDPKAIKDRPLALLSQIYLAASYIYTLKNDVLKIYTKYVLNNS